MNGGGDALRGGQEGNFLAGEGDAYFDRNHDPRKERDRLAHDRIVDLHASLGLAPPGNMLEVGCLTGFRCELFRRRFGSHASGLDPSAKAIAYGREHYPEVALKVGVASELPYPDKAFDCVVIGNFLYWVDREVLFKVAWSVDRVLRDCGIIYVIDFDPSAPHKNVYAHCSGCLTYKMQHYTMFTWNPDYNVIFQSYYLKEDYYFELSRNDCTKITVLRKDSQAAYAMSPDEKV